MDRCEHAARVQAAVAQLPTSGIRKLERVPLVVAKDEGQLYGLVAPNSEASVLPSGLSWTATDGPYCNSASPCAIEPLATPALKRDPRLPFQPAAFY